MYVVVETSNCVTYMDELALNPMLYGIGAVVTGLMLSRELGGFVFGIRTAKARFHRSGTTPLVLELLKMSQKGMTSSGTNSRSNLGRISSGPDLRFAILLKC